MRSERRRLADIAAGHGGWQRWGTYVSDRAWGTVREDYSVDGSAWGYFYLAMPCAPAGSARLTFDVIRHDAERVPLEIYSLVGLVPLFAATVVEASRLTKLPAVMQTVGNVLNRREFLNPILPSFVEPGQNGTRLLTVVSRERLAAILQRVLDEAQFLSDCGVRSLSREHAERPYAFSLGGQHHEITYLPGVSGNRIFGGNSNWRGPISFPMNFLLVQALSTCARYFQDDPHRRDYLPFHEFFHRDNGAGLGAGHQTGWTALIALLLQYGGELSFDGGRAGDDDSISSVQEGKVA
jgi:hypothetical protein